MPRYGQLLDRSTDPSLLTALILIYRVFMGALNGWMSSSVLEIERIYLYGIACFEKANLLTQ